MSNINKNKSKDRENNNMLLEIIIFLRVMAIIDHQGVNNNNSHHVNRI